MNPIIGAVSDWLGIIIQVGAVVALLKAVGASATAPNRTQDERLDALERWKDNVDRRLSSGSHHFDSIDEGNEYVLSALIALMDAQISGDNIDELQKQRNNVNGYLIKRRNGYEQSDK